MWKGLLALIFFISLLQFQNGGFCEEMEQFKSERLAVEGTVINIHSGLPLGQEKKVFLVIAVKANTLIRKDGKKELSQAPIWLLRVPEDKKELFKEYKTGDSIVAYGIRKGKARILDILNKGLGELKE